MKKTKLIPTLLFIVSTVIFFACDDNDYISADDFESTNGYIRGTLSGTMNDGTEINEVFNLEYSSPEDNYKNEYSYYHDTVTYFRMNNNTSLIESDSYYSYAYIKISQYSDTTILSSFQIHIKKTLDDNRYLKLSFSSINNIKISNFNYESSTNKINGNISGYFVSDTYYDEEKEEYIENKFEMNLEFSTTLWKQVK